MPHKLAKYNTKQQRTNMEKENYRANEAAHYLGVSRSTIWLYARQKRLTAIKLSDRVTIFKKSDLDNMCK